MTLGALLSMGVSPNPRIPKSTPYACQRIELNPVGWDGRRSSKAPAIVQAGVADDPRPGLLLDAGRKDRRIAHGQL